METYSCNVYRLAPATPLGQSIAVHVSRYHVIVGDTVFSVLRDRIRLSLTALNHGLPVRGGDLGEMCKCACAYDLTIEAEPKDLKTPAPSDPALVDASPAPAAAAEYPKKVTRLVGSMDSLLRIFHDIKFYCD